MITNNECCKDCPNRTEGCHTTCAAGIAELLVNSIVRDELTKRRRDEKSMTSASFFMMQKRRRKKVGEH